jgi:hypothetical protein
LHFRRIQRTDCFEKESLVTEKCGFKISRITRTGGLETAIRIKDSRNILQSVACVHQIDALTF